nr:MAG TPA: hypothetical protein [Crassvirales sp.]
MLSVLLVQPAICKVVVGCLRKGETGERRTMRTSDLALYP